MDKELNEGFNLELLKKRSGLPAENLMEFGRDGAPKPSPEDEPFDFSKLGKILDEAARRAKEQAIKLQADADYVKAILRKKGVK